MSGAPGPQRPTGVVGLGNVGMGVVRALAAARREIVAFDSDARRISQLGTLAVPAASNAALAHAAGVVLVVVFDDAQLRHVFTASDGILAAADPPDVVAILSTVSADTIRWASAQAAARRFEVIDCGLAVGRGFEQGGVVATLGGSEAACALAAPTLAAFAAPLLHVGPLGSGMQAKLMLNMLQYDLALIGFETGALLRAAGIDAGVFAESLRARQAVGPDVTD